MVGSRKTSNRSVAPIAAFLASFCPPSNIAPTTIATILADSESCGCINFRSRRLLSFLTLLKCCSALLIYSLAGVLLFAESRPPASPEDKLSQSAASQRLKQFISDPPMVAELVAQVCTQNAASNNQTSCYFVLVRYQTNGFFYRESPQLLDLTTTNLFSGLRLAGYYQDDYWSFSLDGRTLNTATNHDSPTKIALDVILAKASILLNLGIYGALPGVVKWDGDSIRLFTNHHGISIQGNLVLSSNNVPKGLQLITEFESNRVPWEIDYEFSTSTSVPYFIPNKISAWSLRDGNRRAKFEVQLVTLVLQEQPLPKEYFMPTDFRKRVLYQVLSTTNGHYYQSPIDKSWIPISTSNEHSTPFGLLFVVANFVLISAVLIVRWQRSATRKQTK